MRGRSSRPRGVARTQQADLIFNLVFFVVLTSVLLQGTSIPLVARWLGVDAPVLPKRLYPIEYTPMGGWKSELKEWTVPWGARADGRAIVELGLPDEFLVVLIVRGNGFVLPSGGTVVRAGDTLLVLSEKGPYEETIERIGRVAPAVRLQETPEAHP